MKLPNHLDYDLQTSDLQDSIVHNTPQEEGYECNDFSTQNKVYLKEQDQQDDYDLRNYSTSFINNLHPREFEVIDKIYKTEFEEIKNQIKEEQTLLLKTNDIESKMLPKSHSQQQFDDAERQ